MHYCKKCEKLFVWPERKQLDVNLELGLNNYMVTPGKMSINLCPMCLSQDIIKVIRCAECNQWCADYSIMDATNKEGKAIEICPSCYEDNHFVAPQGITEQLDKEE